MALIKCVLPNTDPEDASVHKYVSNPVVASSIAVSPSQISISTAPLLISTSHGDKEHGPCVHEVTPYQFNASQSLL